MFDMHEIMEHSDGPFSHLFGSFKQWILLTDFEKVVPHSHKMLPKGHVGPQRLGKENNDGGQAEHLSDREDELLCFFWNHLVQTAHPRLKQH